jgi:hypothetical protein
MTTTSESDRIHINYALPSAGFLTVAGLFSNNIAHQLVAHHRIEQTRLEQIEFMKIIARFWSEVVGKDPKYYIGASDN